MSVFVSPSLTIRFYLRESLKEETFTENKAKNSSSALLDLQPQFTNASAY